MKRRSSEVSFIVTPILANYCSFSTKYPIGNLIWNRCILSAKTIKKNLTLSETTSDHNTEEQYINYSGHGGPEIPNSF